MTIGIPKEIKIQEHRVSMTPPAVAELTKLGHRVVVETGAGVGSCYDGEHYLTAGAEVLPDAEAVFGEATLITKVKEPQPEEVARLRPDHILFT